MSDHKVKFTYSPEGIDPKVWTVDLLDDIRASEYIAMQKESGIQGFQELMNGISNIDPLAIKALLWLLLKKSMSTLSWESLDFTLGEVEITDPDEKPGVMRAKLERLAAEDALNPAGKKRLAELIAAGVEAEPEDPKA